MVDIRTFTAVDSNFNYEVVITENRKLEADNKILKTIGVLICFGIIGITIYYFKKELDDNKIYTKIS